MSFGLLKEVAGANLSIFSQHVGLLSSLCVVLPLHHGRGDRRCGVHGGSAGLLHLHLADQDQTT